MQEAGWDPELMKIFARQSHPRPAAERRRVALDIDGDVEDLTVQRAHEFALRMGYIGRDAVERLAATMRNSGYGQYLLRVLEQGDG